MINLGADTDHAAADVCPDGSEHRWRYSNSRDHFFCTTLGCRAIDDPDTGLPLQRRQPTTQ